MFRLVFFVAIVIVVGFIWLTVWYYTKKLEETNKGENTGTPAPKQVEEKKD